MAQSPRRKPEPQLDLQPQEGVHLNMAEADYFGARALGSSDFSVLAEDPASWWYGSAWNEDRRQRAKRSAPLNFGAALHALILEGEDAYRSRFTTEPEPSDPRWAKTPVEVRKLLESHGVDVRGVFDVKRLYSLARQKGLTDRVWDLARVKFEHAKQAGLRHVTLDEDRRLRHMAGLVERHKDLGPGLRRGLTEVSVFWRREDDPQTLLRARFDKLQPGFTIDLKTLANWKGGNLDAATFDAIADEDYDLQAEHYRDARTQLCRFVRDGKVWSWASGGADQPLRAEREILEAVAERGDEWRWIWVFYQVRNDDVGRERAPVIRPWNLPPTCSLFTDARPVIERALANYREWRSRFGLTEGWSEVHPIEELPLEKLKRLSWKRSAAQ
jgi:hypothetical protein